jgi:hypothetical protein
MELSLTRQYNVFLILLQVGANIFPDEDCSLHQQYVEHSRNFKRPKRVHVFIFDAAPSAFINMLQFTDVYVGLWAVFTHCLLFASAIDSC